MSRVRSVVAILLCATGCVVLVGTASTGCGVNTNKPCEICAKENESSPLTSFKLDGEYRYACPDHIEELKEKLNRERTVLMPQERQAEPPPTTVASEKIEDLVGAAAPTIDRALLVNGETQTVRIRVWNKSSRTLTVRVSVDRKAGQYGDDIWRDAMLRPGEEAEIAITIAITLPINNLRSIMTRSLTVTAWEEDRDPLVIGGIDVETPEFEVVAN